jgi:predicted metal-dependent hydrolase
MDIKQFTYRGIAYEYSVRKNVRAKRVSISLQPDGKVTVTKPTRIPLYMVDAFVKSQAEWISVRVEKYRALDAAAPKVPPYKDVKERARTVITERVHYFAPLYNQVVKKITIRNQKTRWGSCSANGTLSFNYHLLFIEPELLDYVIVHEICHLLAHNHSGKFWKLVAEQVPNYRQLRAQLRKKSFSSS